MQSDEEIKDNRYFPTKEEQFILTQTIEKYFSLPERSEERAIVVKSVTSKLHEINPRWTNRAVRLWFNNNKKSCLKSPSNVPPNKSQEITVSVEKMPPKKRPPSSLSTGSFMSRPVSPFFDDSFSDNLTHAFLAASLPCKCLDEKKIIEMDLTECLVSASDKIWMENVKPINQLNEITENESLPGAKMPNRSFSNQVSGVVLDTYSGLETGTISNGIPYIIDFDLEEQNRYFCVGDKKMEIDFPFRASSIYYDENEKSAYIASGNQISKINTEDMLVSPQKYIIDSPPMLRSTLTKWGDKLVLGSRRNLYIWDNESQLAQDAPNYKSKITANIPNITSISSLNDLLIVASRDHHSVHLLNQNLQPVLCLIGHVGGITSICSNTNTTFLTGSTDLTARLWETRFNLPVLQIQRHHAPLSVVYCIPNDNYIFTGGEDHYVKVWDLRMKKMVTEYNVGNGIPISINYNPTTSECYSIQQEESTNLLEKNPNLCVQFQLI